MKLKTMVSRFLLPRFAVSLYGYIKFRSLISLRSEVELDNLKLGRKNQISSFCKIKTRRGLLQTGDNVNIATGCFISTSEEKIIIGNDVLIGPNCTILANNYRTTDINQPIREQGRITKGTRIGNDVLIGAGTVILDGTIIEDGCVISALSLVSGKIPKNSVVSGNPAKVIFTRR
ncbi:MAG: acyltransferase [Desulforhopalus sp.]